MPRLLRMPGISADAEEVDFLEWCSTVGSTLAAGAAIAMGAMSCLLYTSPSPRDVEECRMPSSA